MVERHLCSLFMDLKVRTRVKPYIESWMFESELYRNTISALKQPEFSSINPDERLLFALVSHKMQMTDQDVIDLKQLLIYSRELNDDQVKSAVDVFKKHIQERMISKAIDKGSSQGVDKILPLLRQACDINMLESEVVDFSCDDQVNKLYANEFPSSTFRPIKSHFSLINHFSSYGGYKYGDLAMFVAAPGVGKSTMMVCEGASALLQGYKVYHVCMGDMSLYDIATKYIAYFSQQDLNDIIRNPTKYMDERITKLLSNLRASAPPAMKYDSDEIVSQGKALKQDFNFDMMIMDYDGNLARNDNESMYMDGGYSYGLFKGFGTEEKCVFLIGSQPKPSYWDMEILPIESANESSRKQHAVDFMITLGKKTGSQRLGKLNLAKVRRGTTGMNMRVNRDYKHSTIIEIGQEEYDKIDQDENSNGPQTNNLGQVFSK